MKRRTVLISAAFAIIALFVSIGVATGTPGSGAVSVYTARGTVGSATEQIVLATPRTVTVTRSVRVKTKRGTVRARVKLQVPGIERHIACGATACDTVFQVLTIQPGGFTGWHTHPGPTFVAVAQGEGCMRMMVIVEFDLEKGNEVVSSAGIRRRLRAREWRVAPR